MNLKVDEYIDQADKWQAEMEALRAIILACGLTEEFKWRVPCYTHQKSNVVLIGKFKEYCSLAFFKGVLLTDELGVLIRAGENSQSGSQIRFTSVAQISKMEDTIKAYIFEAIELEKAGAKVSFKKTEEHDMPEEFEQILNDMPALKSAYEALTPGRQRAYLLYFSAAKQAKTRLTRIEKYIPRILSGKGINDCTCGLTKRKPNCDGSHKDAC